MAVGRQMGVECVLVREDEAASGTRKDAGGRFRVCPQMRLQIVAVAERRATDTAAEAGAVSGDGCDDFTDFIDFTGDSGRHNDLCGLDLLYGFNPLLLLDLGDGHGARFLFVKRLTALIGNIRRVVGSGGFGPLLLLDLALVLLVIVGGCHRVRMDAHMPTEVCDGFGQEWTEWTTVDGGRHPNLGALGDLHSSR